MSNKQFNKAIKLQQQKKYTEALILYKIITQNTDDPRYYISYGVCLQKLAHWKQSIIQLKKGIELKPHYGYGDALLFLAESYLKINEKNKAIELWQIAKELEPMYPSYDYVKNEANKMLLIWNEKKSK
jgi:tetratricopeptide (TPR) repeat protein